MALNELDVVSRCFCRSVRRSRAVRSSCAHGPILTLSLSASCSQRRWRSQRRRWQTRAGRGSRTETALWEAPRVRTPRTASSGQGTKKKHWGTFFSPERSKISHPLSVETWRSSVQGAQHLLTLQVCSDERLRNVWPVNAFFGLTQRGAVWGLRRGRGARLPSQQPLPRRRDPHQRILGPRLVRSLQVGETPFHTCVSGAAPDIHGKGQK